MMTNNNTHPSLLTLGPVQYNWPAHQRRDFYFRMADEAPLDVVYLGENVCSKRTPFFDPFIPEIAERLQAAGKQVVFSTLALVMDQREQDSLRDVCQMDNVLVEANDVSALSLLDGRPHIVGPFVNIYNEGSARYVAGHGAKVIVFNNELPQTSINAMTGKVSDCEFEVQVFGRLPLAISARCYHARAHGLHKDGCQYVCAQDSDGMDVETLEDQEFLGVNGTQTQSHSLCDLSAEIQAMQDGGVTRFRLWPQWVDMVTVATLYRKLLDGAMDTRDVRQQLQTIAGFAPFANGFFHQQPGANLVIQ